MINSREEGLLLNGIPKKCFLRACWLSLFIIWNAGHAKAQIMGGEVGADSLTNAVLPILTYSSTEGIIGGALYSRYNYKGNAEPFNSYLKSSLAVSTRGFIEADARFEKTRIFGPHDRSIFNLFFHRYTADNYFGIGNSTTFSDSKWHNDYYFFRSLSFGMNYKLRLPLYIGLYSQFDLTGGLGSEYHIPYVKKPQSSFGIEMPNGSNGGWIQNLNTGFVWENRDSEFDPHHGNRAEFELRYSPEFISDYAFTSAKLELRQYFYLFNSITVANKLEARHVEGNVPYWELSTLGNRYTLRGYPLNRFMGSSSVAYTLELRSWLLKFPYVYNLKIGGQLFTDVGRVYTSKDDLHKFFEGYRQTIGFGGALSIFNPDFILRGEVGFSEDLWRIYVGIGYLF